MEKLIAGLILVLLVGCGTTVKVVKVPVPVQIPRVDMPLVPSLRTAEMHADHAEFVKALSIDYANLMQYSKELRNLLEVYSKGLDEAYLKSLRQEITID
jgi:hypothetical protein